MLVLTRRVDESISIGENIIVTVLAVEGDRVKLGIAAPREVPILRQEVYDAIQAQNRLQEKLATSPEPDTFNELRKLLSEDVGTPPEPNPQDPNKPGANKARRCNLAPTSLELEWNTPSDKQNFSPSQS